MWNVGCGKDICERRERADVLCGVVHSNEETRACKQDLDECPNKDARLLDEYSACYAEAGGYECDPTDEQRLDALDCLEILDDLSTACVIPLGAL